MIAALQLWSSSHNQSSNRILCSSHFLPSICDQTTTSPAIMVLMGRLLTAKVTVPVSMVPLMSRATAASIVMGSTELAIAGISIDRRIGLVIGAASDARARVGNA
jgi:hypothetical protein